MSDEKLPLITRVLRDCIGVSPVAAEAVAADMTAEELDLLAAIGKELADREAFVKARREVEVDKREPLPKWPPLGNVATAVYSAYHDRKNKRPAPPEPQPTEE